jgi:hypothetical protein
MMRKPLEHLWKTTYFSKSQSRAKKMGSQELTDWADNIGSAMAALIQDYRRNKHEDDLDELNNGVSALQAIVEELLERHHRL